MNIDEAKGQVKLEQHRFIHALKVDDNGTLHQVLDPSECLHANPLSREINTAWDELTNSKL